MLPWTFSTNYEEMLKEFDALGVTSSKGKPENCSTATHHLVLNYKTLVGKMKTMYREVVDNT
jgi:hypothetical protein